MSSAARRASIGKHGVNTRDPLSRFSYDIDFVNGTAKGRKVNGQYIGAFQIYGNNNNDGRLLRDPNNSLATYCPTTATGSVLSLIGSSGLRRNSAGNWNYPAIACPATFLWNRDFTNAAWVKTTMTATLNQVGAEGTSNVASSLTATGTDSLILQTTTATSNNFVFSAYVKRLVGSGEVDMTMDGGVTWTSITTTTSYTKFVIFQSSVVNPTVGFRIRTSGDSIAVDFSMLYPQKNSLAIAVQQNVIISGSGVTFIPQSRPNFDTADAGPFAAIVRGGPWAWYWQFRSERPTGGAIFTGDVTVSAAVDGSSNLSFYSVATTGGLFRNGLNNVNKAAGWIDAQGNTRHCLNGGAVASGSGKTLATTLGHMDIGTNGADNLCNYGILERWSMAPNLTFSNSELQAMTT